MLLINNYQLLINNDQSYVVVYFLALRIISCTTRCLAKEISSLLLLNSKLKMWKKCWAHCVFDMLNC